MLPVSLGDIALAEEQKPEGEEAAATEEADAVTKKDGGAAPAGGPNQKLILIVLVLNAVVLIVLAVVVWKSYVSSSSQVSLADIAAPKDGSHATEGGKEGGEHGGGEHGKKEGKEGKDGANDNFVYESFTVNLADSRGSHFAKVDVAIEVDDPFVKEDINKLRPKIRDFINVVLSSKTYEQIESVDGREFLREEIRNKVNGYLSRGQIKNVFFTGFIVQ